MVGIPGETWAEILRDARPHGRVDDALSSRVAVNGPWIFAPYPGTPMFDSATKHGYVPPTSLDEMEHPYLRPQAGARALCRQAHPVHRVLPQPDSPGTAPDRTLSLPAVLLRAVARWRWRHRFFSVPLDYTIPAFAMNVFRWLGLGGIVDRLRPGRV